MITRRAMQAIISRDAARAAGLKRYFTGMPCRRGHVAERYVKGAHCIACVGLMSSEERAQRYGVNTAARTKAIAAGATRYFTGEPCANNHIAKRYVTNGACVECVRLSDVRAREAPDFAERNREKALRSKRGIDLNELPPPLVADHCDLCGKPTAKLCWDHDHVLAARGAPPIERHRGWLCYGCNTGLGKLGDNERGLAFALDYLRCQLPWQ